MHKQICDAFIKRCHLINCSFYLYRHLAFYYYSYTETVCDCTSLSSSIISAIQYQLSRYFNQGYFRNRSLNFLNSQFMRFLMQIDN